MNGAFAQGGVNHGPDCSAPIGLGQEGNRFHQKRNPHQNPKMHNNDHNAGGARRCGRGPADAYRKGGVAELLDL
jgi:hypothetical protein